MRLTRRQLPARASNYLFQSGLATVSLLVILVIENSVFGAAIGTAVASTAFTVFLVPNSVASTSSRSS